MLTLLITSVNYRRDHLKDTRTAFLEAVKDVAKTAAELWSSDFTAERLAHLRGAVTYLQHILPHSIDHFAESEQQSLRSKFAHLVDVAMGREDFSPSTHRVDLERVLRAQTVCAAITAEYSAVSLRKMGLLSLVWASARDSLRTAKAAVSLRD